MYSGWMGEGFDSGIKKNFLTNLSVFKYEQAALTTSLCNILLYLVMYIDF